MGSYRIEISPEDQRVRRVEGVEGAANSSAFIVLEDVTDLQAEAITRRVTIYLQKIKWEIPGEGFDETVEKITQDVKAKTHY